MKLFYYDNKHELVIAELELGELSPIQQSSIGRVIEWMRKIDLLDDRYRCMIIANNYEYEYEDGERFIRFN